MDKVFRILVIAILAIVFPGCSGFWGKDALSTKSYLGTNRVLVVILPTVGGEGSHYESQGFIEAVRERGFEANLKVLDVKPRLYLKKRIVHLLKTEVIAPAKAEGYKKIYLIGMSLGGHGALLYVTAYPEDIDGVLVLAPFISGPVLTDSIEKAGGLDKWEDCPFISWGYACNLWQALKDYVSIPENRAKIALGYGTEDKFADECRVLADSLLLERVFTVSGGHDWVTWKKLWIQALDYFQLVRSNQTDD